MKAIVWTRYGPPEVLQLQEVETPVPKDDQVRVRIRATTVTAGDCEVRGLNLPLWLRLPMRAYAGLRKPVRLTILGQEFAGEVESVGQRVTRFKVGDSVFGAPGFGLGCYAEYICLPEAGGDAVLAEKPVNMTYEEAAAIPFGAMEALHFLRQARIEAGEHVLINGAGGSIGTFGVQLAKYYGAEVTAVDGSRKLDMLRSIGADRVIDYTQTDFTRSGETYDVIFDVIGKSSYTESMRSLEPNGRYVLANLLFLKGLVEAGVIRTVIDRTYPLEQMVEAHRYVETGEKLGNLIITISHL
jgi:NADPH:quinone reductase-like Zn-dependent oxidoreductase